MTTPHIAIYRTYKHKSARSIRGADDHATRAHDTPNADADRTPLNRHLVEGDGCLGDLVEARIRQTGATFRKDSPRCVETFMSASPDYFRPGRAGEAGTWDEERLTPWVEASMAYLRAEFGAANIVRAILHLDESTPHISAFITPINETGGKSRLNAKRWLGGSLRLATLQTDYAASVEHLGIQRGQERSRARHTPIKAYYAAMANQAPEVARLGSMREQAEALAAEIRGQEDALAELRQRQAAAAPALELVRLEGEQRERVEATTKRKAETQVVEVIDPLRRSPKQVSLLRQAKKEQEASDTATKEAKGRIDQLQKQLGVKQHPGR